MRKRQIGSPEQSSSGSDGVWLDLDRLATVEVTSEDPAYPIEAALLPGRSGGWRAGASGPQTIRLLFDEPQRLRRIYVEFVETEVERTQEFALRWSADGGQSFREIVRQQWNFSPTGSTREVEDFQVDLAGVTAIECDIKPSNQGSGAVASLSQLRLA